MPARGVKPPSRVAERLPLADPAPLALQTISRHRTAPIPDRGGVRSESMPDARRTVGELASRWRASRR
jgi:hypothetical protein